MKILILALILGCFLSAKAQFTVLWDRSGAGEESYYGVKIVPLGDQNNDGYADWAVWAGGSGPAGQPSEEKLEFFHGDNPPSQEPYLTFYDSLNPEGQITYFSEIGDVNGDGYKDWEIWWQYAATPTVYQFRLYWGGPNASENPDLILHGPTDEDIFPLGDFNGDGFDDLYLYFADGDYGQILYGGSPMDTIPDWTRHSPINNRYEASIQTFRDVIGSDINGDGFSDFVSDTPPPERITYIFLGGSQPDTLPAYTWQNFDHWPYEIILDLNGDGNDDLVFHGLHVHFGRDSLFSNSDYDLNFYGDCSPLWKFSLPDISGDGYNDMAVIDDGCNNLWGTLCIYLGHPWLNQDPAITIQGRTPPLNLIGIRAATGLGDINGDGLNDWAIGAANTNFDGQRGRVVILSGDTTLRVDAEERQVYIPKELKVSVYPNPFNSETTIQLELPPYSTQINLTVYNLLGQQVFSSDLYPLGQNYNYHFNASFLATGLYLLQTKTSNFQTTQKIMVLK